MTMVHKLRGRRNPARVAGALVVAALAGTSPACLQAKDPPVHYNHAGVLSPGAIGTEQLQRGGPLPGYFQPVEIKAPPGASISTAEAGAFSEPQAGRLLAGMLIGSVYRLRVTGIPNLEGHEVYPTIEVIDRLYPPIGQEFRFPILIELAQDELEMALAGRFVTRVVYLEEPRTALGVAQDPDEQSVFEVAESDNPLDVADALGRPVAILRLGGRVPSQEGPDEQFLYGSPPLVKWKPAASRGPLLVQPTMAAGPAPSGAAARRCASCEDRAGHDASAAEQSADAARTAGFLPGGCLARASVPAGRRPLGQFRCPANGPKSWSARRR